MNIKLIRLLVALCAVLLIVIGSEYFYARKLHRETKTALKVGLDKSFKVTTMPTINLAQRSEENFADMVDRPLFIKGRRPVAQSREATIKTPVVPTGPFNWQLNGVYTRNGSLHALLTRLNKQAIPPKVAVCKSSDQVDQPKKGNVCKLAEGSEIDGWLLTEIHSDKVVLNQGSNRKELQLRKPKPKARKPDMPPIDNPVPPMPDNPNMPPNMAPSPTPDQAIQVPPDQQPVPPDGMPPMDGHVVPPEGQPIPPEDGQVMPPEEAPMPEPEPDPMMEPEPEPMPEDVPADEFSDDMSTFENGNEQQF